MAVWEKYRDKLQKMEMMDKEVEEEFEIVTLLLVLYLQGGSNISIAGGRTIRAPDIAFTPRGTHDSLDGLHTILDLSRSAF